MLKKALGDVLGRWLFREVTIASVREVSPRFRRLLLSGDSLQKAPFTAGDKVQVILDEGARTYTPFAFNAAQGAMSLLVYLHGNSPGARWGRQAAAGQSVRIFGPRGSLPLPSLEGPVVLFGDETSLAVARALREQRGPTAPLSFVFEVSNEDEAQAALEELGLTGASFAVRSRGDEHLNEIEERVRVALETHPGASLVLTGKATSIQALRSALRAHPAGHARQKVKAYWATGKRGLD